MNSTCFQLSLEVLNMCVAQNFSILTTVPVPINGAPSIRVKNILQDAASSNGERL